MRLVAFVFAAGLTAPALGAQISIPAGATLQAPGGTLNAGCADLSIAGQLTGASTQMPGVANLTIASGGTFSLSAATVSVGGNWSNAGTFTHNGNSTVAFVDTCATGNAAITGSNSFFNLTFTSLTGRTLTLPSGGGTSVAGALLLSGTVASPIQLLSANPALPAQIVLGSGATLSGSNYQLGTNVAVGPGSSTLSVAISGLDFGGQSMGTTSPPLAVTLTNTGASPITFVSIAASAQFSQTNNCTTLAPAASCTVNISFLPTVQAVLLNAAPPVAGALTLTSNASGSPQTVTLAGAAEKSLVTHYYRSILRRAPDAGGKAFWQGEAARIAGLGANVNEGWYSLSATFFVSAEYGAFNRDNAGFVTDLYNTFFNRVPDSGGLAFWLDNLGQGMPREVALTEFMFSTEFRNFTQAIFGATAARAEVDAVMDFYRGLLARLPEDGGFVFWRDRFRAAQCQGAAAVTAEAEAISSAFALSGEYTARGRTNAQYVGDLYNAFLRRGGDLGGVLYWIGQLNSSAQTREQLRLAFKNSAEFQARVTAIIQQGCF